MTMDGSLKIYHRCNFWGREINGRHPEARYGIQRPVFHTQVVLENYYQFFGCCFSDGRRVVELKEHHFVTHHTGAWNLFLMRRRIDKASGAYLMSFGVCPDYIPVNPDWIYQGTIPHPHTMRMDLGRHFNPILCTNKPYGYQRNHVHLMIVMDTADCPHINGWDYHPCPSRDRKLEKKRHARKNKLANPTVNWVQDL
jgi:hypothetical protein